MRSNGRVLPFFGAMIVVGAIGCRTPQNAQRPAGERSMIATLQRMANILCTEPLSAEQVAHAIGTVTEDYGGGLQIVVHPSDAAFRQADVSRQYGTQIPSTVVLTPADPRALTLGQLRAAFGEYSRGPVLHSDDPQQVVFAAVCRSGPSLSCALLATVSGAGDEAVVDRVTLRRDKL